MSERYQMIILGPRQQRRGRRALYGEPATERIEFVCTREQRKELERVVSETGKKLATVIREAVNEYVADYSERKVFDR